jgi:hypothetical protein
MQKRARISFQASAQAPVSARLAHCLPFFHREARLCFSIYIN